MKKLIFLSSMILLASCSLLRQEVANPYKIAYKFITMDLMTRPQNIAVSDSLDEFDNSMAKILLKENYDSSFRYDSLDQVQVTTMYNHKVPTPKKNKPVHYLIFSRIQNRMLTAEIIDYQHFIKYGNDRFTTIRLYYFVFDERMKIKKTIVTNVIND